ncbi:MAG TPA: FixH family protein [Vicinamibacterales bacterium]|nr:FixH family protein [Vicinamibacterales bacterium]
MIDTLFVFLFKYPLLVFQQGRFAFGANRSMWLTAAIVAAGALYALWTYRQVAALQGRDRVVLLATRVGMFAVVLFGLLRPMLLLKVAVPQQNFVGILLDDSRSMQVADHNDKPRGSFTTDEFGSANAPLLAALGKRFNLRIFRFSSNAERLQYANDLKFEGTATRLGDALDRARAELSGLPVAGMVVVTDGSDNADRTIDESIAGLKAAGMPVFPVGVGKERLTRDIQVTRVETPRQALRGAALVLDAIVTQVGYAGQKVNLVVEDNGRVVGSQQVVLPGDGESQTVKVRLKTSDVGPRTFQFSIAPQPGEEVAQNNKRDALIDVVNRREKVLYLEGEPRPEPKFVRQATDKDDNLQVVLLQRTAEATVSTPDKFLRLGVDDKDELLGGFPAKREDLYKYKSIILGTVEASAFTPEQQRMLEDFVDIRGGGLLALGGPRSFSEGGWAGTPLGDALPVVLDRGSRGPQYPPAELLVKPTRTGVSHPSTQITDQADAALDKWRDLPTVTSLNPLREAKPGANVLLTGVDERGREQIVMAAQRYGRGKTIVLTPQDTWLWRMHQKMDVKDPTFHNFWQRLVRWLVDGVPDRVSITPTPARVQKGEPVSLSAEVLDKEYKGVNDGRITVQVTSPSGKTEDVPMEWTVEHDGEYRARFTPAEDGLYKVSVGGLTGKGEDVGRGTASLRVAPSDNEYFDAAMRAPLLQRLADETEGRFYRAKDVSQLPEAITYSGKGITMVEERELWDMPIMLVMLLGFMGGEWLYRRRRGLA